MENAQEQSGCRDEIKTRYDLLVDEAFERKSHCGGNLKDEDFLLSLQPDVRDALVISCFMSQVLNGGLAQWADNGYGDHLRYLEHAFKRVGTELAAEAADMAAKAVGLAAKANEEMDYDDEEYYSCQAVQDLDALDDRFYEIDDELVSQVTEFFEKVA